MISDFRDKQKYLLFDPGYINHGFVEIDEYYDESNQLFFAIKEKQVKKIVPRARMNSKKSKMIKNLELEANQIYERLCEQEDPMHTNIVILTETTKGAPLNCLYHYFTGYLTGLLRYRFKRVVSKMMWKPSLSRSFPNDPLARENVKKFAFQLCEEHGIITDSQHEADCFLLYFWYKKINNNKRKE